MICFNKDNLVAEFLPFLFTFHQVILQLRSLLFYSVGQFSDLHFSTIENFFQLSDFLIINVQSIGILSFYVLNFDLALRSNLIYLKVFDAVKLGNLSTQVLYLSQKFLLLELKVWHVTNSLVTVLIQFIFEHVILRFMLV